MLKPTTATRFDEDNFDLGEHKKAADAVKRDKAHAERKRRQVKYGKVVLAIVTVIIFFGLFYIAAELGWMNFR
ncbi:MAG: hypothetical protein FWF80_04360 [Defluviitaleaceae bacterium]|nr:hypothetical protein [Defluviitaleaceae bacterium]